LTVFFKKEALEDLVRIAEYGETKFGIHVALAFQAKLARAFTLVEQLPEVDHVREELRGRPRLHYVDAHVVVYQILPEGVEIIRILGSRQNLPDLIKLYVIDQPWLTLSDCPVSALLGKAAKR
jgi:plasmid stabilization system protein ParE